MIKQIIDSIFAGNLRGFKPSPRGWVESRDPSKIRMLYVHIPFCEELCPFCSFHRVKASDGEIKRYFNALRSEIKFYSERGFRFTEVYFGGGTPTIDARELCLTIELIRSLFPAREVSLETNPNGLDGATLALLADSGVDRLSVGVQSFDDSLLKKMDRYKKYGSGAEIRERLAFASGRFRTLNVDMMFNLPGQTRQSLERDIDILLALAPDQITFYPLMAEPSVRDKLSGSFGGIKNENLRQYYNMILSGMSGNYTAGTAWCFSRKDAMIDEYIVKNESYVGIGSGAFSYVEGAMYASTFSIEEYIRRIERSAGGITHFMEMTLKQRIGYDFMVKLFSTELGLSELWKKYGFSSLLLLPEFAALCLMGAFRFHGRFIRLSRRGMYLWVLVMSGFFNAINSLRAQMRRDSGIIS